MKKLSLQKGITLYISMIVTATLLLISVGIAVISAREASLATFSRESQFAFYAADTGAECALYWDLKTPDDSAFSKASPTEIDCNHDAGNPDNHWTMGAGRLATFTMTFLPDPYCATVTVTKDANGSTTIESFGHNTCSSSSRRVERAVRVTY